MPSYARNCVPFDSSLALDFCHQHVRVCEQPYSKYDEYPFRDRGLKRLWIVSPVGSRWSFVCFSCPIPDQVRFSPLPCIHVKVLRVLVTYSCCTFRG